MLPADERDVGGTGCKCKMRKDMNRRLSKMRYT